jgi:hypothetical protein
MVMEKHEMRVFEHRVQSQAIGAKKGESERGWRK